MRASYRPDIDGLRAFSVTAVILNHLAEAWVPGGYVGVDVFFVISGFVITASLAQYPDRRLGPLLAEFWARRVRRLAPALVLCVVVTGIATWALAAERGPSLWTGLWALFGVSNIHLALENLDYFSPARDLNTVLHTWSLGVEEQFYLVFPVLFVVLGGLAAPGAVRRFLRVMAGLSLISFAAFLAVGAVHPESAFFLSPFRFWQLGAGALLYVVATRWPAAARPWERWVAPACMAGLVAVLFLPGLSHGLAVTLATGLAAGVILFLPRSGWLHAAFTVPGVVYVGLISYPLYLWHWPVISLGHWTMPPSSALAAAQLVLMLALAAATYELVEKPVRYRWQAARRRFVVFGAWGSALALSGALMLTLVQEPRLLGLASAQLALKKAAPEPYLPVLGNQESFFTTCVVDRESRLLESDTVDLCTVGPSVPGRPTVWTMGDSHAGHLQAMVYGLRGRSGVGVHLVSTPGVQYPTSPKREFKVREEIFDRISGRFRRGDIILLGRLYFNRKTPLKILPHLKGWLVKLDAFAGEMAARGLTVVVVGPPPMFEMKSASLCIMASTDSDPCAVPRAPLARLVRRVHKRLGDVAERHENLHVFEVFDRFCPPGQARCSPVCKGTLLFRDRDHMNTLGAGALAPHLHAFLVERGVLPAEAAEMAADAPPAICAAMPEGPRG